MGFKVYINEGERYQIRDWVLNDKVQNVETGGDLFGLWLDEQTAVVQFVLGPGENCRRTATSFFQVSFLFSQQCLVRRACFVSSRRLLFNLRVDEDYEPDLHDAFRELLKVYVASYQNRENCIMHELGLVNTHKE